MNLNQIHYLLAIYKYGSITQAAEKLFVSAPSISVAISNLERELRCNLLIRHHHGVTFTEQGEKAVNIMKEIEERLESLYHLTEDHSIAGEISIGVSLHAKSTLYLPIYLELQKDYPGIVLNASDEKSWDILRAVEQNQINIGLIHYSSIDQNHFLKYISHNELNFITLFEGSMLFVVRENHPITTYSNLTVKDVLQYPFLNYYKTDFTKEHKKVFQQINPDVEIIETKDRDMFRDLLHSSNAVTIMPSLSEICNLKQFSGLVFLHVSDFHLHYVLGCLHSSDPLSKLEQIVVDTLKKEADKHVENY